MKGTSRIVASLAVALALLASCSQSTDPNALHLSSSPGLGASTGGVITIDFENQPIDGSSNCLPFGPACTPISNPLKIKGVTFTDPFGLVTGFCSSPTCQPDPDNPQGGNIQLFMNPGGTIDLPPQVRTAVLTIEGIGDNPFQLRITDAEGNSSVVEGAGILFDVVSVDLASPTGIDRIEVLSVGGTGGPLVLSAVQLDRR